eukprot:scaffold300556_cov33-Tisochrysis_lutea.AAC.2
MPKLQPYSAQLDHGTHRPRLHGHRCLHAEVLSSWQLHHFWPMEHRGRSHVFFFGGRQAATGWLGIEVWALQCFTDIWQLRPWQMSSALGLPAQLLTQRLALGEQRVEIIGRHALVRHGVLKEGPTR